MRLVSCYFQIVEPSVCEIVFDLAVAHARERNLRLVQAELQEDLLVDPGPALVLVH